MSRQIDKRILELYDEYCHTGMDRREFLRKASLVPVVGGSSGLIMAQALLPDYAKAQTIQFTDQRIKALYVTYDSPGGNAKKMRGYLVQPQGEGPFPAVLVVHENRGLNPYIEDVTRRVAVEGFLAFAPDALSAVGGYPGNDDDGKVLQAKLDREKIFVDMVNAAKFLRNHKFSNGNLGVTGFCFGGAVANHLACVLGPDLKVSVPYYGSAPNLEGVKKIKAAMVVHYAEDDPRVNETRPAFEKALKTHKVKHEIHTYPGTSHGFHNYSTPRYDEKATNLSWQRTISAFRRHLQG